MKIIKPHIDARDIDLTVLDRQDKITFYKGIYIIYIMKYKTTYDYVVEKIDSGCITCSSPCKKSRPVADEGGFKDAEELARALDFLFED